MASCKDCLHVEVCQKTRIMNSAHDYAPKCDDFKDRSHFKELPCEVGDRVYAAFPKAKATVEYVIVSIWVEEAGAIVRAVDTTCFTFGFFMVDEFGKKLFFTKEEAEQALKEREGND